MTSTYAKRIEARINKMNQDEKVFLIFRTMVITVGLSGTVRAINENNPEKAYRHHSAKYIQDTFGLRCRVLFELMFERRQKGGVNTKGERYKTMWRFNMDMIQDIDDLLNDPKATTAKYWVNYLKAKGYEPRVYAPIYNEKGLRVDKQIITKSEYHTLLKIRKQLKQEKQVRQKKYALEQPELDIASTY